MQSLKQESPSPLPTGRCPGMHEDRGSREWWGLGQTGELMLVSRVCQSDPLIPCEEEEPGVKTASEFSRKVYLHGFR